jgi:O-antigen/teichoic acid export membrane protein
MSGNTMLRHEGIDHTTHSAAAGGRRAAPLLNVLRPSLLRSRWSDWGRRLVLAGAGQAAVQILGFAAGIVVIRSVPPTEYAYYTIASAALGLMSVLSDGGIANGVLAQGGPVWQDRTKLGAVLAAGLALRRRLSVFALVISLPLITMLVRHQGAGWLLAIILALSILPSFSATLYGQLLEIVPRLHQRVAPLQAIQITANLARFACIALVLPYWPFAAVALTLAALPQWWTNYRLRSLAGAYADWRVTPDIEIRRSLLGQVRRTIPAAAYYALSSQVTVWLASLFGMTSGVAAVGALGRLALVLSPIGAAFSVTLVPRFARIPATQRQLIWRRYWQLQGSLAMACGLPIIAIALFPTPTLALLGPHYSGLEREAILIVGSSAMGAVTGLAYVLGATRGVVVPPLLLIPYSLLGQLCLIWLLPLSTVAGVASIGLLGEVSLWIIHVAYFWYSSRRTDRLA